MHGLCDLAAAIDEHEWCRHTMRASALSAAVAVLDINGSKPLSRDTPLRVGDVIDLFETFGRMMSKQQIGQFILQMLQRSKQACSISAKKMHEHYEKGGKQNTLKAIKERISSAAGLSSEEHKTFCEHVFWPPEKWRARWPAPLKQGSAGERKRRRKKAPQSASAQGGGDGASYAQIRLAQIPNSHVGPLHRRHQAQQPRCRLGVRGKAAPAAGQLP